MVEGDQCVVAPCPCTDRTCRGNNGRCPTRRRDSGRQRELRSAKGRRKHTSPQAALVEFPARSNFFNALLTTRNRPYMRRRVRFSQNRRQTTGERAKIAPQCRAEIKGVANHVTLTCEQWELRKRMPAWTNGGGEGVGRGRNGRATWLRWRWTPAPPASHKENATGTKKRARAEISRERQHSGSTAQRRNREE